ncbi:hypothetical protein C491_17377 [Natronococcus amylolyticus DSM 10524]|uniref:Uncharacterized protein n=1 Tax=Natronococcus amylolyticus DSM 10524 TaxID=1227497 RepID=L9X1C4_9EURY|nr:hypothetical protein C491_17377 [Natronococcus amylolyticus DSM 10524]
MVVDQLELGTLVLALEIGGVSTPASGEPVGQAAHRGVATGPEQLRDDLSAIRVSQAGERVVAVHPRCRPNTDKRAPPTHVGTVTDTPQLAAGTHHSTRAISRTESA